ncbi:MAG TPA: universal stress protein [Vicinamibacterales bacterium]|nr:universal stress protein [Vicinamibacterales bacterium]
MVRIQHILCPVDRSEISHLALDHARVLASWYDASLSVMEVIWPGMPPIAIPTLAAAEAGWPLLAPEERAEYQKALELFCGPAPNDVVEQIEVVEGPIVDVIQKRAVKEGAQLIVMGTHGRGGFQRAILGSATEKVMRKAACPVLVVPPHLADDAYRPTLPYKKILCAIDFSPVSTSALAYAMSLAQESAATLVLAHVLEWPGPQQVASDSSLAACALAESMRRAAEERLHRSVPHEARAWCQTREIVPTGKPHLEIIKLAASEHADLIVTGVHSRPAVVAPFFGSTANQVVRHATCPVLVVRP